MGAIEAIKKGFAVTNKNPGLVAILFAFSLIGQFINIKFIGIGETPVSTQLTEPIILIAIIAVAGTFVQAGNLGIIRDYFTEGKIHLINFPKYGLKYFLRLLGLGLAIAISAGVVFFVGSLIIMPTAFLNAILVGSILSIILEGIGFYWVLLLIALSPYGVVCGELPVIQAMAESVDVTRRFINKVALLFLIIGLISLAWTEAIKLIPGNNQILISIIDAIFNGYFGVMMPASCMALYLSLTTE